MVNGTNTSGFGYDSDRHCVYAEAAVWESYIEVHKEADRAQGNRAKDFVQMENDANLEEETQQMEDEFERPVEGLQQAATTLNQAMHGETDIEKKASMVAIEISKMGSMTVVDKFKASRKIMRDPQAVATFWNYEGEDREIFYSKWTTMPPFNPHLVSFLLRHCNPSVSDLRFFFLLIIIAAEKEERGRMRKKAFLRGIISLLSDLIKNGNYVRPTKSMVKGTSVSSKRTTGARQNHTFTASEALDTKRDREELNAGPGEAIR
ncbi:hypothetical protein L1887_36315 [Cichorium endivia]|nr:hypothetical protein L1887_36315 [Cichorium endivia]